MLHCNLSAKISSRKTSKTFLCEQIPAKLILVTVIFVLKYTFRQCLLHLKFKKSLTFFRLLKSHSFYFDFYSQMLKISFNFIWREVWCFKLKKSGKNVICKYTVPLNIQKNVFSCFRPHFITFNNNNSQSNYI